MSIIPQAFRLTTGDGKIPFVRKDFYPSPGDYDVAEKTSMTHELTAPHFPKLSDSASPKYFGSSEQRVDTMAKKSPALQKSIPGPGEYDVEKRLGSDLPGATKDYHDEYDKVLNALVDGRYKIASAFPSVVSLSKSRGSKVFENLPEDGGSYIENSAGKKSTKPRDQMANRFYKPAPDPYTWMLGPGSYNDSTLNFGADYAKSRVDDNRSSDTAKWGNTHGVEKVEVEALTAAQMIVSPDRLPSEKLIVGYKSTDTGKDFNKIYRDVSISMEALRISRRSEQRVKGWKKELKKMKAKRRRHSTLKLSRFKAPSQFGHAVRIDMDEDKKKLGVLEPGPGQYEARSSFPENTESAVRQELVRAKRKMKKSEGVDLDNNGVDDGLEIEAMLPPTHQNKNTSSFVGSERDTQKYMSRYGKSGSNPDVPGPMSYDPEMGKSPSMSTNHSSNVLAYRQKTFKYQGKKIKLQASEYDARGKTLHKMMTSSQGQARSLFQKAKKQQQNVSLRLQDQEWFKHGSAPVLKSDMMARQTMQAHHNNGGVSPLMAKTAESLERLKIDTEKLSKAFFGGSPTGKKYLETGVVHANHRKAKIDFSNLATNGTADTSFNLVN